MEIKGICIAGDNAGLVGLTADYHRGMMEMFHECRAQPQKACFTSSTMARTASLVPTFVSPTSHLMSSHALAQPFQWLLRVHGGSCEISPK
jgi:hypothetical protein